jgi:hypothetical protein
MLLIYVIYELSISLDLSMKNNSIVVKYFIVLERIIFIIIIRVLIE